MDGSASHRKPTAPLHPMLRARPRRRSQCIDGPRPCPWVSCRHHLAVDVVGAEQVLVQPGWDDDTTPLAGPSCSLDVADVGPQWVATVAQALGVGSTRMLQIEREALSTLYLQPELAELDAHPPDRPDGDVHDVEAPYPLTERRSSAPQAGAAVPDTELLRQHLMAQGGVHTVGAVRLQGTGALRLWRDDDVRRVASSAPELFELSGGTVQLCSPSPADLERAITSAGNGCHLNAEAECKAIALHLRVNLVAAALWRERLLTVRGAARVRRRRPLPVP